MTSVAPSCSAFWARIVTITAPSVGAFGRRPFYRWMLDAFPAAQLRTRFGGIARASSATVTVFAQGRSASRSARFAQSLTRSPEQARRAVLRVEVRCPEQLAGARYSALPQTCSSAGQGPRMWASTIWAVYRTDRLSTSHSDSTPSAAVARTHRAI